MAVDAFGIVGTVIASAYHVESVVAEGGFGTVYRAHHGGFRAPVALKCLRLPPGLVHEGRQHFLESFRAEAELLFRLSASIPTVVRPLHVDAFTAQDGRLVPYMVLEWLEGRTLDALVRKRRADGQAPLPLKKLVRLLTPVARALERAHNFQGPEGPVSIVHRDVKPENIFVANVAGEEVVKILDFGIGKAKSVVSQVAGRASQAGGGIATFTPAYGSPEQWAPKRYGQTGPWTDVWGLALSLSEALVGHPLIEGEAAAIMGTILDPNQRPTPGSEGVIVSDEVEAVFEKALALDPRQRYADAGVFWNELLAAARISSGEQQEVRLPRDARAEPGGGVRVERLEVRKPSTRLPAITHPVTAQAATLAGPPPAALSAGTSASASSGGAAYELELLPLVPATAPFPPAVSGSFQVPDLDLAPVSRPSAPQRTSSGLRAAVAPPVDLDEVSHLQLGHGASLDLDLPSHDPLVRRVSSSGIRAVRPSEPPPGSLRTPLPGRASQPPRDSQPPRPSSPPGYVIPPAAVATSAAPPPISYSTPTEASFSSPPVSGRSPFASAPSLGSLSGPPAVLPPVSRGPDPHAMRPFVSAPASPARFRLTLEPHPDATLFQRLLPGGIVVASAILATILDQLYSVATGEVFRVGSMRTSVVAGVLMLAGIALCAYRLKRR